LGLLGLCGFLWALRNGQFEDLDGAANRVLFDEEPPEEGDCQSHYTSKTAR